MTAAQIIWLALSALIGIILIAGGKRLKASFKGWLLSAIMGFGGLLLITYTAGYTGIAMSVNLYTGAASVILGLPGVILMLVLNLMLV